MNKWNNKIHIIYGIMVASFVFMMVWVSVKDQGDPLAARLSKERAAFDEGWVLEDGSQADVSHLNRIPVVEPYKETSVYHKIPENLGEGLFLCFRSKNIYYQVYVDGELRYEPYVPESRIYNDSLGTKWNYIPLYEKDAGKTVEVRFYTVYESSTACMDHLYIDSAAGEILHTFSEKIVSFITCLLLLFVGALLVIADIPINMQKRKNHELLYLGLFADSVAVWCMAETNLFQFFTEDSRLMQSVSCISLIMVPIPLVLYLDAAFGFKKHVIVPIICYMSAAEFVICTLLHFGKILDYHDTLKFSHILIGISAVLLLVTAVKNSFYVGKEGRKNIYRFLRVLGLAVIALAAVIDLARFYQGNTGDSAMFVRIGLLVFIMCYGSSSLEKTVHAVKLGVQAEFVSQLAYRDGLTGIGNRTAFKERLEELEKEKKNMPAIGIIMFDVNDLKYVNDNLGHQKGDEMLFCSADIIKNALEPQGGSCYRIGGDEFAVILWGENVEKRCQEGILRFTNAMKVCNKTGEHPFRISIASGYAVYDSQENDDGNLGDIYEQADAFMYANKKKMKSAQIGPEEYYARRA